MSADTIQFLRGFRRGGDPDQLFHAAWELQAQDLDEQLHTTAEELIARQNAVEAQVQPLVARVAALDIVGPAQRCVEESQRQVEELRAVGGQLQSALTAKKRELQAEQHNVATLGGKIMSLGQQVHHLPCPEESFLLECGRLTAQKIGGTTRK
jgi:chromosome segregation ATPase